MVFRSNTPKHRLFAPYCKACRVFGVKFRKLALERGDRINAAGVTIHTGKTRFGELDQSRNIALCKSLGVKALPAVLVFRGGADGSEKIHQRIHQRMLSQIVCKQNAVEDIASQIDHFLTPSKE